MGYDNFYTQQRVPNYSNFNSPQQSMMSMGLKGRPVSSIEEARATQIDFDGSLFIFPDIANKRIYTKQIGMNGIAVLNMYELKPIPSLSNGDYVTREEFESAVLSLRGVLEGKNEPAAAAEKEEKQSYNF